MLAGDWQADGPFLPVEYCRQSKDGRLTLVVTEQAPSLRVLWSATTAADIDVTIRELAAREGCSVDRIAAVHSEGGGLDPWGVRSWLRTKELQCAIWTALPPKFGGKDLITPTSKQAVSYLRSLSREAQAKAEEYVRKTPKQIRTAYREIFEHELGWDQQDI